MALRFQWKTSRDALHLVSEPYLGFLRTKITIHPSYTLHPKLYFSYNAKIQQTTIITTDLNRSHLWMIQHLKELSGMSVRPEVIGRLLFQYFVMAQECFTVTAVMWDEWAADPVCCKMLHYTCAYHLFPTGNGITNAGQRCGPC